ncbi:MAG: hypothetical protein MK108_07510 [Mariniblastus sp.]|nr:hypothetical protein [Mariniblastus sp.]
MNELIEILPLANSLAKIWFALPLVIAISLVYGATRHEYMSDIVIQSYRSLIWVVGFMAIIFAIIFLAGFWN